MITAKKVTNTILVPQPPVEKQETHIEVTLKLTQKEANDLRQVCYRTGGNPTTTRGLFDRIAYALDTTDGVNYPAPRGPHCVLSDDSVLFFRH